MKDSNKGLLKNLSVKSKITNQIQKSPNNSKQFKESQTLKDNLLVSQGNQLKNSLFKIENDDKKVTKEIPPTSHKSETVVTKQDFSLSTGEKSTLIRVIGRFRPLNSVEEVKFT